MKLRHRKPRRKPSTWRGLSHNSGFYMHTRAGHTYPYSYRKRFYLRDAHGKFRPKFGHTPKNTRITVLREEATKTRKITVFRPDRVRPVMRGLG